MIDFNGSHFEREIVLWGVRWYVAYPISYRHLEEMMEIAMREGRPLQSQSLGDQVCAIAGQGLSRAETSCRW
jgi:hypothetical protein